MEAKQLYNIETDTLITLSPKNLELKVKTSFTQIYFLETFQFAILYFLSIYHPNAVEFSDFKVIINDIGLQYPGNKNFIKQMSYLKKLLNSYGVRDLIIKIKGYGYIISNKWVSPELHTKGSRQQRFANLNKLIELIFQYTKNI